MDAFTSNSPNELFDRIISRAIRALSMHSEARPDMGAACETLEPLPKLTPESSGVVIAHSKERTSRTNNQKLMPV